MKYFLILFALGFHLSPPATQAQQVQQTRSADLAPLDWLTFDEALTAAEVSGRTVLVDVYAPWCPWCAKLQTEVYAKSHVRDYLNSNFETARLNIDDEENVISFKGFELSSSELASGLGADGTPTVVFLSSKGDYITRVPGFLEADEFMQVLKYIGTGAFHHESFQDYRLSNP